MDFEMPYKEQAKRRLFEMVHRMQEANKDIPPEQIERDVDQAVKEVRQMNSKKTDCLGSDSDS